MNTLHDLALWYTNVTTRRKSGQSRPLSEQTQEPPNRLIGFFVWKRGVSHSACYQCSNSTFIRQVAFMLQHTHEKSVCDLTLVSNISERKPKRPS